jgi:sugar phosphate isomerase/epimerase
MSYIARDRVLLALKRAPVSGQTAPRCGGLDWRKRLSELRQMGYEIAALPIKGKPYKRYRLIEEVAA